MGSVRAGFEYLVSLWMILQLYNGSQFLVEETGVSGDNHWPVTNYWQTTLNKAVVSTPLNGLGPNS